MPNLFLILGVTFFIFNAQTFREPWGKIVRLTGFGLNIILLVLTFVPGLIA